MNALAEIMHDSPASPVPATHDIVGDTARSASQHGWDAELDISTLLCPMTFVRTRLALDRLRPGQVLAVRLRGDEPRRNVPRTAEEQGHQVLARTEHADGTATLLIRKGGPPA